MNLARVLSLARAGAADAAWAMLESAGPGEASDSAALSLRGRLIKDRATSTDGAVRSGLLSEAAAAYLAAARLSPTATYPLINAATLSLLGGDPARAAALAQETLALLDGGAHEPDTAYWLTATRAEALLLLGRETEARGALDAAVAGTPLAWEDRAVTLRQFRRILAHQGRPAGWLDALRPPPAVHFAGPIGIAPHDARLEAELAAAAEALGAGTATGALAAGFDIAAAEALLRAGVRLQIILPAQVDAFVEGSVRPAGADWLARFEAVLAAAAGVDEIDAAAGLTAASVAIAEEMAIGTMVSEARARDGEAVLLRLAGAAPGVAGARLVSVSADAAAGGAASPGLAGPKRPVALLGTRHAGASRLAALTQATACVTPSGVHAACGDLAATAGAALALFDDSAEAQVVLDYAPPHGDGTPDTAALDTLLEMSAQRYPIVTRSAALALAACGAPVITAPAGASGGLAAPVEFYSLWRAAPATPPDPRAAAAN